MGAYHFPVVSPDGTRIAGTEIDPERRAFLTLDGRRLGPNGHAPKWIGANALAYNAGPILGTYRIDLDNGEVEQLDPREFHEFAAVPGAWAGRHAPSNLLVVRDTRTNETRTFAGCGQPAMAPDGFPVFTSNDNSSVRSAAGHVYVSGVPVREPHMGLSWVVWGQRGREVWGCPRDGSAAPQRLNVVAVEGRARVVDTPAGPWLLTMTQTDLLLRPLGQSRGHRISLGNDRNLNADAMATLTAIRIVASSQAGDLTLDVAISLSATLSDLTEPAPSPDPIPIPDPPDPEPEPMPPLEIPDRSEEADAFLAPRLKYFPLNKQRTSEATFDAVNALCVEFRRTDPRWYLLVKDEGQNHVRLRGVDVLLYAISDTQAQVLDVVKDGDGHDGPPTPTWIPKDLRPLGQARVPFGERPEPQPEPPPEPQPEPPVCPPCPLPHGGVEINDDYPALLDTLARAEAAHGRPLGNELTAHLCSRFIIRRDPAERIIEEARRRGNGTWQEDW